MIRRKKYLHSACAVPRRTLYRQRMRNARLANVASSSIQESLPDKLKKSDVPMEDMVYAVNAEYSDEGCHDASITEEFRDNTSEAQQLSIASNSPLARQDSGIAVASSSEECEDSESDTSSSENFNVSDRSSDSEITDEDIVDLDSVPEENEIDIDAHQSSEEDDNHTPLLSTPLCESTTTTEGDALLMCLSYGLRHSLSWAAMVDLLKLINHLFGQEVVQASKYFFMKYMDTSKDRIEIHVYCPRCERYLGTRQEINETNLVACNCGQTLKDINQASTYFLSLSFGQQLKEKFKDTQFIKNLNYRFTRKKENEDAYEDVYDGELYRSLSAPGNILNSRFNLSYCFNTDGFPVGGKSGKQTCWPIYIQINELPPEMRSKHMLLAGIYVGKKEPNMKIFMQPFIEEANALSSVGIDWCYNGKDINSKVIPLYACVDSPARSRLLNMTQFNGYYGCTICYCKAENLKVGIRYTIPVYGLKERTHSEIIEHAIKAHRNRDLIRNKKKRSVKGVKGLAPIHTLEKFDLVRGVRADVMHRLFLGNGKHHTLWMHDASGKEFYIGSDVRLNAISTRLKSIKPPSSIMRPPRSLNELSLWKATEWRSWILFYGVVCLKGIIPDKYVVHFSMLSTAVFIILQKSITKQELDVAQSLLVRYVFQYQEFFTREAMVYNVHLLLHTKRDVECLGPAWTNTAFAFEGANKSMLQLKKNDSSVALEMARKYLTFKSLPALIEKYAHSENALKFCEELSCTPLKKFQKIGHVVIVGNGYQIILDPEEFRSIEGTPWNTHREVTAYGRLICNGVRLCTASYSLSSTKHDDSYVALKNGVKARIQKICTVTTGNGNSSVFLIVRELVLSNEPFFADEYGSRSPIKRILTEGQLCAVSPDVIEAQCVAMFVDYGNFICSMPYGCYSDS